MLTMFSHSPSEPQGKSKYFFLLGDEWEGRGEEGKGREKKGNDC